MRRIEIDGGSRVESHIREDPSIDRGRRGGLRLSASRATSPRAEHGSTLAYALSSARPIGCAGLQACTSMRWRAEVWTLPMGRRVVGTFAVKDWVAGAAARHSLTDILLFEHTSPIGELSLQVEALDARYWRVVLWRARHFEAADCGLGKVTGGSFPLEHEMRHWIRDDRKLERQSLINSA